MNSLLLLARAIFGLLWLFLLPYSIVLLTLALRRRLPGIDLAWTLKTRLSPANFDDRGKALRQRGMRALIAWAVVCACLMAYALSHPVNR